jgi:hypothetical protein
MRCPHCGGEVKLRMNLILQEFPGVVVEEGVTPVVGKACPTEVDLLPGKEEGVEGGKKVKGTE